MKKTVIHSFLNRNSVNRLTGQGDWVVGHIPEIKNFFDVSIKTLNQGMILDGSAIQNMDTAGALLISTWQNQYALTLEGFSEQHQKLLALIADQGISNHEINQVVPLSRIAQVGKFTCDQVAEIRDYLTFIGKAADQALRLLLHPTRWRWAILANVIYRTGYQALPIILLLSFMIGIVMAYQMGVQLRNYGANVFIVDFVGLSVLREFGPLLTAIMLAGRTGSAFTAQLGTMKVNQEIDALSTMGVTPVELLILPRIAGLMIVLPLLSVWADIFGVFGGMLMAQNMLGITMHDFLIRFGAQIPLRTLLIGLGKTPVFALVIATIGCFEGMRVSGSADSVGRQTTRSVVLSIFFIIVVDAIFSVIFSRLKI